MDSAPARDAALSAYAQSLIKFKARQLSRKPGFSRSDEEDVAQELTARLLAQAPLYDPKRASANTFAERVIKSAVAMLLRDRRRLKRAAGFTAQSLEQTYVAQDHGIASLREMLRPSDLCRRTGAGEVDDRRAEAIALVVDAFRSLPPDLQDICRRLTDGTPAGTARDLRISRRQVQNAIERVRRHFEAADLGDF